MSDALGRARLCVLGGLWAAAFTGCDNGPPFDSGSRLAVDVDAASAPLPSSNDAGPSTDSPFAPLDGPYGALADGYAPLEVCARGACLQGTYCYGGPPYMTFSAGDETASPGLAVGCHTIPPGCASEPDCVCILQALAPEMSCYPVCTDNLVGGFTVFCPP